MTTDHRTVPGIEFVSCPGPQMKQIEVRMSILLNESDFPDGDITVDPWDVAGAVQEKMRTGNDGASWVSIIDAIKDVTNG